MEYLIFGLRIFASHAGLQFIYGDGFFVDTEIKTSRTHRTLLDRLKLWPRAYETQIRDRHHEVVGRGPTPEASQKAAERRWAEEQPETK